MGGVGCEIMGVVKRKGEGDTLRNNEVCTRTEYIEREAFIAEQRYAEEQGRLVILPCKVGDTVWFYLYENRGGIRKGIYQGIITELKAVQRLNRDSPLFLAFVRFEYPDPWYSFEKLSTSEMHCSFGEYGSWVQFYLTREEAEAALKGETEDV